MKCWRPQGIPTMETQSRIPKKRCVSTTQKPPKINQITFIIVVRQPVLGEVSVILTPKGARPTIANLKHCIPNGIPIMVRHKNKPPMIYPKKMNSPPKIIQIILPNKFIVSFIL